MSEEIVVHNGGIGGCGTAAALRLVKKKVLDYQPDTVILGFGMNDAVNPKALQNGQGYEDNYRRLVKQIKAAGIGRLAILTIPPIIERYLRERTPNHPEKGDLNQKIVSFNQILHKIAKDESLVVIDLYAIVASHGGNAESATSLVRNLKNRGGKDGVHLTAEAYRLLAAEITAKFATGKRIVCFGDSLTYGANLPGAGTVTGQNYPSFLWQRLNPELWEKHQAPTPLSTSAAPAAQPEK